MKSDDELAHYFLDNLEVLGGQSINTQASILTSSIFHLKRHQTAIRCFYTYRESHHAYATKVITNYDDLNFNPEFQCW